MEQLKLTDELAVLNPYLPEITLVTLDEFKVLESRNLASNTIVTQSKIDHNRFFLHALGGWLIKNISPAINWSKQFKKSYNVVEGFTGIWYSSDFNETSGNEPVEPTRPVEKYDLAKTLDMDSYVNIEVLMKLNLLPSIANEIVENVGSDFSNVMYVEGYNKKYGNFLGNWEPTPQPKNLLIIDVSSSIPIGISDMMLHLAPSMVLKMNADLIVTGSESYFYTHKQASRLDPIATRNSIGRGNEDFMFLGILREWKDVHYANVVSFGDQDALGGLETRTLKTQGVTVGTVHHYHTQLGKRSTGYGRWADPLASKVLHKGTDWCNMFKEAAENL